MTRFLHTSDWQLGMTRHFLSEGAQERYNQARFDAVRNLGRVAAEERCQFIVVCGDVFESNHVDRKTVARALEALRSIRIPVFILPGNHDPLNEASVYNSGVFVQGKPDGVTIINNQTPYQIGDDVQIIGAPWTSKRMALNAFDGLAESLEPLKWGVRIVLAHGVVDSFAPKQEDPGILSEELLQRVVVDRRATFIALGDRHSLTRVGEGGRIWYSGTPEATDFGETQAGFVNVVEVDADKVANKPIKIGQWKFWYRERVDINSADDIEAFRKTLEALENKERTIAKVNLIGSISLAQEAALRQSIEIASQVFASFQLIDKELIVSPNGADFSNLNLSGFAGAAVDQLIHAALSEGPQKDAAHNALMLVMRLAGGVK